MRPRFLVVAYACEPGSGSESGAGWIWSRMLATFAEVWVVTRENNQSAIEGALPHVPEREHLHFVYIDLPERFRSWKRGSRGARLYYVLWQGRVVREGRRIDSAVDFDAVWHLTMSTVWVGSLAPVIRKPFVYGPVGGAVATPWRLVSTLGMKGTMYEAARTVARVLGRYANPIARLAWRRAELILVQNHETRQWLPARVRNRVELFPNVVLDEASMPLLPSARRVRTVNGRRVALYAGRLLPLKGVSLGIRAISILPEWHLLICGSGPDEDRLRLIVSSSGVTDRVTFLGRVPRHELLRLMKEEADVFLFPSLHDEGGWVVAEALAYNLPVVCLDRGGPPLLAGPGVQLTTVKGTIASLARAVEKAAAGGQPTRQPPMFDTASRRLAAIVLSTSRIADRIKGVEDHPE
jgi:glycosyltransferase involved in cell wall biosynthesis